MLRIITTALLSLIAAYSIGQNQTLEIRSLLNTQYNLGDGSKVMVVTYQRDAGAPVVVSWQSNEAKASLMSHSYNTAGTQSSRRLQLDMTNKPSSADAGIMWLSTKTFEEIKKGKTTLLLNKDEKETGFVVVGKEPFTAYVAGKELTMQTIHIKSTAKDHAQDLWILDNPTNPIIVKASGVHNFELTDVMPDQY